MTDAPEGLRAPGARQGARSGLRSGQVTLLLVDDSPVFVEVLAHRLRADELVDQVEVASSLREARAALPRSQPDLVLLDLQVGDELGLELIPDLARLPAPPRVLMLSGSDGSDEIIQALEAGVDGWVGKTESLEALLRAVDGVVGGEMYLPPRSLGPVLRRLLSRGRSDENFLDTLTARQLEVLRCLVAGMSRLECADRLHLSVNTVRTHVQTLMKRAGVHSSLSLAAAARDLGVRGIDAADPPRVPSQRSP
jgi:DNA-binding NarL/FixJ family response regulator